MPLLMNITRHLGIESAKGADEGRQRDIGNREESLEQRFIFAGRVHFAQDRDGNDEQGIVGQRRKKLRRHDDVEAERHWM
jgi:hypothetical protein